MRLNLGCGNVAPSGWQNIDRSPTMTVNRLPGAAALLRRAGLMSVDTLEWPENVIQLDIRKRLPYPDRSVDAIYSSHTLEHLYLADAESVVAECFRLLRSGGVLRLALPDGDAWAKRLVDEPTAEVARWVNQKVDAHPVDRPTFRSRVTTAVTARPHRWIPTRSLVQEICTNAGFSEVAEREFHLGRLPDLESVEHRPESLFIEAIR